MKLRCKRCGNEWEYNGEKIKYIGKYPQYVSCTRCHTSVKLEVEKGLSKKVKGGIKNVQ